MAQVMTSYLNRPKIYTPDDAAFYAAKGDWPRVIANLAFDADITDTTGKAWTAGGNAAVQTDIKYSGSGSLLLDGNSYIYTPNHEDFAFKSGNFTINLYAYPTAVGQFSGSALAAKSGANTDWSWFIRQSPSSYAVEFYAATTSTWDFVSGAVIGTMMQNAWNKITIQRSGTNLICALNDVVGSTTAVSTKSILTNTANINIGGINYSGCYYTGYIDQFSIKV